MAFPCQEPFITLSPYTPPFLTNHKPQYIQMTNNPTVVLFTSWSMGHMIPMVELAKLFTAANFSVSIPYFDPPFPVAPSLDPFISRITAAHPLISFHRLPKLSLPSHLSDHPRPSFQLLPYGNPHLSPFLKSLSLTSNVRALVLDMFASAVLDVAAALSIPAYIFIPSSAFSLAAFVTIPTIQSQIAAGGDLRFPGIPPIPASYLPTNLLDRDNEQYEPMINHFERIPKARGIVVNTFDALEPRAAVADVVVKMPPVYCVGPLTAGEEEDGGERHECLVWLDAQPEKSVVFLSFGSMGVFSGEQLREIAVGLERSGQRFLWVVRSPPSDPNTRVSAGPRPEPELEVLMPEGFLERTEGRGMVVKNWAPQVAVLRHEAVGGFVSHCGWNSTLEAVTAGLPMVAWPMYAEQKMNMVFLTEEARVAVAMEGVDEVVGAEEVERKVRLLMDQSSEDAGKEIRKRAAAMRKEAAAAREEGGSSDAAWRNLVREIL